MDDFLRVFPRFHKHRGFEVMQLEHSGGSNLEKKNGETFMYRAQLFYHAHTWLTETPFFPKDAK